MVDEAMHDWALPREEAIPKLVEVYGDRLYALGRRICGNPQEADDLVQEVFLRAWRKWDQFDHRASPMTWLYTIAHRACIRMHRPRAGQPQQIESLEQLLPFGASRLAVPPESDGPLEAQLRQEQIDGVGAAIVALPDDFRVPLVLKDIVGFKIDEVAQILGIKAATVKTRVHRARLKLRAVLAEGLPTAELPPTPYSKQVCLDLLEAKQHSLDQGVEMPDADRILCERCNAVFDTLDLTKDVCSRLAEESLPAELRERILARASD